MSGFERKADIDDAFSFEEMKKIIGKMV
jgi:hypothetical protein